MAYFVWPDLAGAATGVQANFADLFRLSRPAQSLAWKHGSEPNRRRDPP